jgi:hypothetical protein
MPAPVTTVTLEAPRSRAASSETASSSRDAMTG